MTSSSIATVLFVLLLSSALAHLAVANQKSEMTQDPKCMTSKCPKPTGKRWKDLNKLCCPHGGFYHCQKRDVDGKMFHACLSSVRCPPGQFLDLESVILGKAPPSQCRPCSAGEFQPDATLSHHFIRSGCHMKREDCTALNALPVERDPTNASDNICMCNYLSGYRPVPRPDHDCLVFESLSGCRCEHKPCPENQVMSPIDYKCLDYPDYIALLQKLQEESNIHGHLYVFQPCANHHEHVTLLQVVDRRFCTDGNAEELPSWWMSDTNTPWAPHSDTHPAPLILLGLLAAAVVCFVLIVIARKLLVRIRRAPSEREKLLVHFKVPSKKAAEKVYRELKNVLPMLARYYGPLKLALDTRSRDISVLVDPNKCKNKFNLVHFIRDLSGVERIKKELNGADVIAEVSHPEGLEQAGPKGGPAVPGVGQLKNDSGQLVLKFDNINDAAVLFELNSRKEQVRGILAQFNLELRSIRRGSVVIQFSLAHSSGTFDTLAQKRTIRGLADKLLSNESFGRFRRDQPKLKVEFLVKAKLEHVTAVYADTLHVQMGNRNNINTCDEAHAPRNVDEPWSDAVQRTEATDEQGAAGEMVHLSVLHLPTEPATPASPQRRNSRDSITITITCQKTAVMKTLKTEWSNVKSVLQTQYPGCHMSHQGTSITWNLPAREGNIPDANSFVGDLFSIERVKKVTKKKPTTYVKVEIPDRFAGRSNRYSCVKQIISALCVIVTAYIQLLSRRLFRYRINPYRFLVFAMLAVCATGIVVFKTPQIDPVAGCCSNAPVRPANRC